MPKPFVAEVAEQTPTRMTECSLFSIYSRVSKRVENFPLWSQTLCSFLCVPARPLGESGTRVGSKHSVG